MKCNYCKSTGIWLAVGLEGECYIEKCDHCNKLKSDSEAFRLVNNLIYGDSETWVKALKHIES
jgi:hypothetical protein